MVSTGRGETVMSDIAGDLLVAPETIDTDDGDHDRFAHVVKPAYKLTEAIVTGRSVIALCGKIWKPSRDPKKYPVCPTCKEVCLANGWAVPRA